MPGTSLPCGVLCKALKIGKQGNLSVCTSVELGLSLNIIYCHSETAPSGSGPPHDRSFTITLRHAHSVGVLWKSDQPVAQNST
jgi:hypothetical protein